MNLFQLFTSPFQLISFFLVCLFSVVVVLSEGNMEPALLPRVIARGLTTDGRLVRFEVRIDDRLGTMATLLRLVTSTGAM